MPMSDSMHLTPKPEYRAYMVWDAPTRWFHWINAICVIGLIATGLVVLNGDALGLSAEGKVARMRSFRAPFVEFTKSPSI